MENPIKMDGLGGRKHPYVNVNPPCSLIGGGPFLVAMYQYFWDAPDSGSSNHLFLRGSNQCKCIVILRDF